MLDLQGTHSNEFNVHLIVHLMLILLIKNSIRSVSKRIALDPIKFCFQLIHKFTLDVKFGNSYFIADCTRE